MTKRIVSQPTRSFRHPSRLWDDAKSHPKALGCLNCVNVGICGGVHNAAGLFDCNDLCTCPDKTKCDVVCRNAPERFVARMREIEGFDFSTVRRNAPVEIPHLPAYIPMIDHKSRRRVLIDEPVIAVSLYHLINRRTGEPIVRSRRELEERFLIPSDSRLVISGVGKDPAVEGWWEIAPKEAIFRALSTLNVGIITSPNFSVLTDHPRTDNLHAMKRILIAWSEIVSQGFPCAIHINARTECDYGRWADEIGLRDEISAISFEFGTGAGWPGRIDWHINQLKSLARTVKRPLTLVTRGGGTKIDELRQSFAKVSLIDTHAFSRTMHRQKAQLDENGRLVWHLSPTRKEEYLDDLLSHNIGLSKALFQSNRMVAAQLGKQVWRKRRIAPSRDYHPVEPGLLAELDASLNARAASGN